MIPEKLENIALRARMLLGQVSPVTWRVLRGVPAILETASEMAKALEAGDDLEEGAPLSATIVTTITSLRDLGGVAEPFSYEAVRPLISDLENILPLAEALDGGMPLVSRTEPRDEPLPAA